MFQVQDLYARIFLALGLIVTTLLGRFWMKLHTYRSRMRGLPGPPHSYLWGHLKALGEVMAALPSDAHGQLMPLMMKEKFNLGDVFYLDAYPFAEQALVICDVEAMKSVTTQYALPKHAVVHDFMAYIGGPGNLVSSEGPAWKRWRSAFNPGFSAKHIMSLVPVIVDECQVFCDLMQEKAKSRELFRLERAATKLSADIIGKVALDVALDSQRKPNTLVDSMLSLVTWMRLGESPLNPMALIDIRGPFMLRYQTWKMNRYLGQIIEERFATRNTRQNSKAVIDLALNVYLREVKGKGVQDISVLDPDFKTAAISNMKAFIFAGHDTTSSTIVYALYYLFKYPDMLATIRKEHDDVFGTDPNAAAQQLREDPYILNKLIYTTAVIREVLRFQPPASTIRGGLKDVYIRDPDSGQALPTEHMMVWPVDVGILRNKKYWPDPHTFNPERHLSPTSEDDCTNNKEAWIPFSSGPRNCIGQELAMVETKVVLAMIVRSIDFHAAFDEAEKLRGDGSGYKKSTNGIKAYFGDEAYQIAAGTAKPREGMPCRLSLRM